jgi:ribosome-associated protein
MSLPEPPKPPPPPRPPTDAERAAARVRLAARALAQSDEALLLECEEQFFIASGPGGQHRNKTETGVRLTHRPTAVTVTATERRSQLQNRGAALERLRATLKRLSFVPERRIATKPSRGSKRRRLEGKKHLAEKKQNRRGKDW